MVSVVMSQCYLDLQHHTLIHHNIVTWLHVSVELIFIDKSDVFSKR